jgi:hypothetical protein
LPQHGAHGGIKRTKAVKKGKICPCNKSLRIGCVGFFYLHCMSAMQIMFADGPDYWQDRAK